METSSWSCGFHILFQIWSAWTEETSFVSWLIFFFLYYAELNEITLQQSEPLKPKWAFPVNSFCHKYKFISMCHSWHLRILKQYGALLLAFLFFFLYFSNHPIPPFFPSTDLQMQQVTCWPVTSALCRCSWLICKNLFEVFPTDSFKQDNRPGWTQHLLSQTSFSQLCSLHATCSKTITEKEHTHTCTHNHIQLSWKILHVVQCYRSFLQFFTLLSILRLMIFCLKSPINCCFVWVPKADWQEFAQSTCIPLPMYLVQCTSDCWHVIETEKV